jgi:hypothetical protein
MPATNMSSGCWVIRDKFMELSRGETQSMTYRAQNPHQYQYRKVRVDLSALQRLNLTDVFRTGLSIFESF